MKHSAGISFDSAWVKVFRIIPEFRILRLAVQRKQPQNAEFRRKYSISNLFLLSVKIIDYLQ